VGLHRRSQKQELDESAARTSREKHNIKKRILRLLHKHRAAAAHHAQGVLRCANAITSLLLLPHVFCIGAFLPPCRLRRIALGGSVGG